MEKTLYFLLPFRCVVFLLVFVVGVPIMVGHAIIDVATVMQILATSSVPGLYETMCGMG